MTDSFAYNIQRSTIWIPESGSFAKTANVGQYLSLLKCVWLIRSILQLPDLRQSSTSFSHWPSYIDQLKHCSRFSQDLMLPALRLEDLTPKMLTFWPNSGHYEGKYDQSFIEMIDDVGSCSDMKQVLDVQLQGSGVIVRRRLQLFRLFGTEKKRLRVSGMERGQSEQNTTGRASFFDDTFSEYSKASTAASVFSAYSSGSIELPRSQPFTSASSSRAGPGPISRVKPMLVLFAQDMTTKKTTLVAMEIDGDTIVNPERCNCRRPGLDGSACTIASIEPQGRWLQGNLPVRKFEGQNAWDVAQLAIERRGDIHYAAASWKDIRRISIMFPSSEGRARFGGTPSLCGCGKTCLEAQHKGCHNCLTSRTTTLEPCQNHTHPFHVKLDTGWKPLEFLETYLDDEQQSKPKIASLVTYTGLVSSALATTCSEYLKVTWPQMLNGSDLLDCLETLVAETRSDTPASLQSGIPAVPLPPTTPIPHVSTKAFIRLSISETHGSLVVRAEGTAPMLVELVQQVAWLTSALRAKATHHYTDVYVVPLHLQPVDLAGDENDFLSDAAFIFLSSSKKILPTEESCWLDLVSHGTAIARGFPVPNRDAAKGLEIPLPILVEMAGVRHVVEFQGGVVMKGLSSMLLPISRTNDIIQWHLVSAPPETDRLTYQAGIELCKTRALLDEVPLDSITKSRAVVGWCRHAVSRLGSEDVAYENIDYSDAKEVPAVINVSSVALGIQQIGMGQVEFTVGARHARSHFKREGTYAHLLNVAARMKVLLYDTRERRAWLVGADEVILHIIRKRHSMEPFYNQGREVKIAPAETAKQTLLSNRTLILMEDDERPETLRDMVSRLFSLFEFLIDENVKRDASPEMTVSTHAGSELAGYEFMAVAEEYSPYHRKHSSILKTSGGWTALVEACDALVLFASGFEDLICPTERGDMKLCHKYGTVPRDNDYLATRVALLTELYAAAGCKLTRECLSSSGLCWHREALLFEDCVSPGSFRCSCNRLQRIVPKSSLGTIEKPGCLDEYGAVIFGRSSEGTFVLPSRKGKEKATFYQQRNIALASTPGQSLETLVEESSSSETNSEDKIYDSDSSSMSSAEKTCKAEGGETRHILKRCFGERSQG
ncbi:hypothetical protein CMUS01_09486 [Colletotrichum musicola]|uniref:Pfs domain-containing protein n=1 Tax=Colletotrichum musicola TaxID=2175873 RepID=A0A8H6K8X0_9PEZI|nr:hypothetical protein CMUS01_09486 [Colletotrichum musicola]